MYYLVRGNIVIMFIFFMFDLLYMKNNTMIYIYLCLIIAIYGSIKQAAGEDQPALHRALHCHPRPQEGADPTNFITIPCDLHHLLFCSLFLTKIKLIREGAPRKAQGA